jgi:hypothetical protein
MNDDDVKDIQLKCVDGGRPFTFEAGEQRWFKTGSSAFA